MSGSQWSYFKDVVLSGFIVFFYFADLVSLCFCTWKWNIPDDMFAIWTTSQQGQRQSDSEILNMGRSPRGRLTGYGFKRICTKTNVTFSTELVFCIGRGRSTLFQLGTFKMCLFKLYFNNDINFDDIFRFIIQPHPMNVKMKSYRLHLLIPLIPLVKNQIYYFLRKPL